MRENQFFAYAKTKVQISCAVTAQLISAFVSASRIVLSLFYSNPKFQDSSSFSVRPGQKPGNRFSRVMALQKHVFNKKHLALNGISRLC